MGERGSEKYYTSRKEASSDWRKQTGMTLLLIHSDNRALDHKDTPHLTQNTYTQTIFEYHR